MISQNQNLSWNHSKTTSDISSIGLSYEYLIAETANRRSKVTIHEQRTSNVSQEGWDFQFRYSQKTSSLPKEMRSIFLSWQNSQRAVVLFHPQLFLNFRAQGVSGNSKRKNQALRWWPKPVGELPNLDCPVTAAARMNTATAQRHAEEMDACSYSWSEHSSSRTRLMSST